MGVCPFHDTPPCESKIKLSVIRILSLSFAPFGNILFFYFSWITSALLTEVLAVLQISMLCAIFWENFISLDWSKVIVLQIPTAVAPINKKAVITLEHLSLLLFAFMVFTFLFCLFFVFLFDKAKLGTTSSLFNLLLPFHSFFDATVAPFCNKSREHPPYLSQTRQFWEK